MKSGSQQVGESPSSSQHSTVRPERVSRDSEESGRVCLFVEGDQEHKQNSPCFPSNIVSTFFALASVKRPVSDSHFSLLASISKRGRGTNDDDGDDDDDDLIIMF